MKKLLFLLLLITCSALAKPTLNQEIGQMIMVGFDGTTLHKNDPIAQDLINQRIGGVILFDYNYKTKKYDKNIQNPKQLKQLTQQLKSYAKHPLLIGIDYEGGIRATRLQPSKGFPKTYDAQFIGSHSVKFAKTQYALMAQTLKNAGINLDFAPVVDLNINPDNPIIGKIGRSYSANPKTVVKYASIFTNALHRQNILCVLKHFPGHGSSKDDTHLGFVDVTQTWQPQELTPYKKLLNTPQGCQMVLTAHIVNDKLDPSGLPASLSKKITTDLLRQKLGFSGVVITDDLQMGAITKSYNLKTTVKLAIQSGADILLFGNQLKNQPYVAQQVIAIVDQLVKDDVISRQRIDESYARIMRLKQNIK